MSKHTVDVKLKIDVTGDLDYALEVLERGLSMDRTASNGAQSCTVKVIGVKSVELA